MDSRVPYRTPLRTRTPVMRGPQTATVVGKDGEDIWTDQYGRVKIQFHWDREGERNENSSCFVRVSQVWAGDQWGGIHIPRIGQEVIVDFLEGDPDQPIITGRVYNGTNMPPYELPTNQTQSGIKSRSSKEGGPDNFNEIRFEDKKGEEELHIQAEKNMTTLVKNDQSNSIKASRSSSIGGSDSVSVGGDRSLSVNGNLSITVKGGGSGPVHSETTVTGKHALHASDTIEMDAPTHIKLTCGGSSILIEPGKISISAGGEASIVLDSKIVALSADQSRIQLDANVAAEASGKAKLLLYGNACVTSKDGTKLLLDPNAAITTGGEVIMEGAAIKGTGQNEVVMAGGGSSCELNQSGATVSGGMVTINGQSMVSVAGPMIKIG
jgi:type VI secretion system secreted protein VgrG